MNNKPAVIATKLREILNKEIPSTVPNFNIYEAVKLCGGQVINNQNLNYDAHIIKIDKRNFLIEVNPEKPETRKRFSIAHELGHWFLHIDNNTDNQIFKRDINIPYNITETEANQFAAEFLMPKKLFIKEIEKNIENDSISNKFELISSLSNIFGVSYNAANIRGKVLKIWR